MNKTIIALVGMIAYIVITTGIIILGVNIINDLRMTAEMYKNSKEVCKMEYQEMVEYYEEILKEQ